MNENFDILDNENIIQKILQSKTDHDYFIGLNNLIKLIYMNG